MSLFAVAPIPHVEQQAMRLDGELYSVGELFVPISLPEEAPVRAAAACVGRSGRLIAARTTAAWVWGATVVRPTVEHFVVDIEARWRAQPHDRVSVVESVLLPGDVVDLGAARVTSRIRTAIDICRFTDDFGAPEIELVRTLAADGGFSWSDVLQSLDARPRLAGKRGTLSRLALCFDEASRVSPS